METIPEKTDILCSTHSQHLENDYEWLKLYHHIITKLVRCKGYPITEVLAMLTLGVSKTEEGRIREKNQEAMERGMG